MDLNTLPIEQLGLSVRSTNALHREKVHLVGDLTGMTPEQLYSARNLGKKSVAEILAKIEELKTGCFVSGNAHDGGADEPEGEKQPDREAILSYLQNHGATADDLEFLSAPAYNILRFSGNLALEKIIFKSEEELLQIPHMTRDAAKEITDQCRRFVKARGEEILAASAPEQEVQKPVLSIIEMVHMPEYHDRILLNARRIDMELQNLGLSKRSLNRLTGKGYRMLSDIIFLSHRDLTETRALGTKSVQEIEDVIRGFLSGNELFLLTEHVEEDGIPAPAKAVPAGVALHDSAIQEMILSLYKKDGFRGYSLKEMSAALGLPETVDESRLKKNIGALLAAGELEYVDFRCYRLYDKFSDELEKTEKIDDRAREIIRKRLEGVTLEGIAKNYGLTRERVRQIINSAARRATAAYHRRTGKAYFDEDYFRYFYQTYAIERKDAAEWLGIPEYVFRYFDMMNVKKGNADLNMALEDNRGLEAGMRFKIKNYINRNKIFIDGVWVEKQRAVLEKVVLKKFCREQTSFNEFVLRYNNYLRELDVEDEDLLITEGVVRTRSNKLENAKYVLWSWSGTVRYYDIDGQDYEELFSELNLNSYENVQISTWKLFHENPELMRKYDLRDHYELHNLLRKTVENGLFHDFTCENMPYIRFGEFDRDAAILDLIIENAPIKTADLCSMIQEAYGYDPAVTQSTYLMPFAEYCYQGIYKIDHKAMSAENREKLLSVLDDDFYFFDELRQKYTAVVDGADPEEINSYNLKLMGFTVLSRYAFRNYLSLDAFFRAILTENDIINVDPIKYRFRYTGMFYATFQELRENLEIIEFEKDHYISIRKLEESGVTKEKLLAFCDEVWNFVDEGEYFSICSLRQKGFASELYDLGFSGMFYAGILQADERFKSTRVFGSTVFRSGNEQHTIRTFIENLVNEEGFVDLLDLMSLLNDYYGCSVQGRSEIWTKVSDTDLYYDETLDRLYKNKELFYQEFDEAEGF